MNTHPIHIVQATTKDLLAVQQIAIATFTETFSAFNTQTNMKKYVQEKLNEKQLLSELANPDSLFFIARDSVMTVGYLKLNTGKAQTELQDDKAIEIERIYVKASYHGQQVGQILYEKAMEIAKTLKKEFIWLAVWEENPRAIRFYEKNGFAPFDKHTFTLGDETQTDIMMKKSIANERK